MRRVIPAHDKYHTVYVLPEHVSACWPCNESATSFRADGCEYVADIPFTEFMKSLKRELDRDIAITIDPADIKVPSTYTEELYEEDYQHVTE